MTITLQIPRDIEMKINEKVSRGDTNAIRLLLLDALIPTIVEAWKNKSTPLKLSYDEFEALADQLEDEFMAFVGPNCPPLSDYAVSREGIYEDHL
jgi:antitoxin ParD1/3/4